MIATPHILIGAAIGLGTRRFFIAAAAAYASHFILDALPSLEPVVFGGPVDWALMIADVIVAGALLYWLLHGLSARLVWFALCGVVFSILPDLWVIASRLAGVSVPYPLELLHGIVQFPNMVFWGSLSQLTVAGLSIWYIKRKSCFLALIANETHSDKASNTCPISR